MNSSKEGKYTCEDILSEQNGLNIPAFVSKGERRVKLTFWQRVKLMFKKIST